VKRGGEFLRVEFNPLTLGSTASIEKFIALDEALSRLAEWDPRQARIVELRFFGGLTEEELAEVTGTSVRTVRRDWSMAKDWLHSQIGR
jgi:RNA polymerase sigma factor (sigma-70 family)